MRTETRPSTETLEPYRQPDVNLSAPSAERAVWRPLIIGHYGGSNTGDEAMLEGLLHAIDPTIRSQISVVVKNGTKSDWPIRRLGVRQITPGVFAVLRTLRTTDALVLCGGTHFHDDYETRRYLRHIRYMSRFVLLSMLSRLWGKKVTWLGMGFGPFYRRPTQWITRLGLRFCDRVSVRDIKSLEEIAGWVPPEKLDLTFDLAGLLAGHSYRFKVRPPTKLFNCSTLGISATSARQSKSGGYKADKVFWRRLAGALTLIMQERKNLRVRVMVLRGGDRENDEQVSIELHRAISNAHPGRSELIPYNPEPTETWKRIAECDAFIATRFHAGVLAYLAECRLLFLAYHRKVRDLANEIGLAKEACLGISDRTDESEFASRLRALTSGDESFRARLPVTNAISRALLNVGILQKSL